jgi:hypothetical protein
VLSNLDVGEWNELCGKFVFLDLTEIVLSQMDFGSFAPLYSVIQNDRKLFKNSVCVACDGAAAMMASKYGVTKIMEEKFPSLILCHYGNYR